MSRKMRNYEYLLAFILMIIAAGLGSSISIAGEQVDPVTESALSGDIALVRRLLEAGADVNAASKSGMTPLHAASLKGHTEIVKLLLEAAAKVNAKDKDDTTALILALQHHHIEIVK
ncbi:MAG: ankyrin repeat domain-containing protein, partial [Acidobacteria bacterium]|nr:ankyrin repeat domain-containing protein [Acidobacteriota bacterium]